MAAWESAPLVDEAAPAAAPGRRPAYEAAPAAITPGSALPNVAPPAAAPQAGLAPREVGFTETTGRTAGASAIPVARTLGLAAATIVGLIRGPEARDRVFAKTDEVVEGMRRMYEPQPGEQMSMPGQIVGGIAGAPIEVAGGFGLQRGVSKAADVLQRGGTGAEAAVAGGVTGAANVAANLLPVKVGGAVGGAIERGLVKAIPAGGKTTAGAVGGAATGGGLGALGNVGVVAAENASLPEGEQFKDLRTEASPGVAGGLGAGLGAVAGALGARGVRAPSVPKGTKPAEAESGGVSVKMKPVSGFYSPEAINKFAEERLAALETKGKEAPDQTVTTPEGKKVTVKGKRAEFVTDEDRAEIEFLRKNAGNVDKIADGYGLGVEPGAKPSAGVAPTPEPGAMPSAGAAGTKTTTQRAERAAALPVPIELTKGQRERGFEQQRFERETAKQGEVGRPLRERFSEQNERVLKNFDEFVEQTGAGELDANAVGKSVTDPIVEKAMKAKDEIRAAYGKAEAAGETAELVPTDKIVESLSSMDSSKANAGVISAAESELVRLGGATRGADGNLIAGEISLADLEEVRKVIGKNGGKDDTNAHFAGELRAAIDASTDGRGGELYQAARKLHREYAAEFKNQGVIRDLIGLKKGTSDRKVAIADVFDRSVLNASLEDLRNVKRTLTTAGEKGAQAWNDLRGKTIDWIKEQAAGNSARDERGNPIVSPAKLDRAIKKLDQDGRLDELFGKQGAQQLRDINDLAKDVYTTPPGAVNTSNTGSLLIHALDTMATYALSGGAIPLPAMAIVRKTIQGLKERKVKAKVRYALGPGEPVEGSPVRAFEPGKEPPVPPRGGKPPGAPPAPPAAGAAGAARGTKRERDLVGLREHATDPQVLKDLDAEIAAERRSAVEAKRAAEYRAIAEQTDDPGIKAKFTAKADKLAPPEPKAPEPEPIPVAEARELTDAEIDPVERVRIEAELETAWRREHRVGDMDAERAKAYARAEQLDPEAADRAVRQHENSPRAFDREIARIIEEGETRETQGKQDSSGGAGVADGAAASRGEAGGRAQPPGADGDAATGAQRGEAEAPRGSAASLTPLADLFREGKGIARGDMPVIPDALKPAFRSGLEADGVKVTTDRVQADTLKPTQRDYNEANVNFLRGEVLGGRFEGNPIVVSNDGRVLDGHHRWAIAAQHGLPVDVLRVDLPIDELLTRARAFSKARGVPARDASQASAAGGKSYREFAARIGEIEEQPGLNAEQRAMEQRYAAAVRADPEGFLRRYAELKDTAGGKIVNTDEARELWHEYAAGPEARALHARAVHEPSSWLAKVQWSKLLEPPIRTGRVLFLGGGGGSGKTSSLDDIEPGYADRYDAIYDTTLANEKSAVRAIEQALASGRSVVVSMTYRAPLDSIINGIIPRAARKGRTVPLEIAAQAHRDAPMVLDKLRARYVEDPRVEFQLVDNTRGPGQARKVEEPPLFDYNGVKERALDAALKEYEAGRISTAVFRGLAGQDASPGQGVHGQERPGRDGAGRQLEPQRGQERNRAGEQPQGEPRQALTGPAGFSSSSLTERGLEVDFTYRLVDVGDLVTSHDDALRVNPAFPPEIQPRDRARDASEGQIARIENGIRPELLADSPKAGDGAPFVGSDAVVESGNARTIALRRAYASGKADGYRTWLEQNAARFGFDPKEVSAIKRPMLVRENTSNVDRAEFARQANESTVAGMSETEQAATDAKRLPDVEGLVTNDSGEILTRQSEEFIRQFMRYVASPNELNQLMTADGRLSQRGVARIRNAVFARAYGDASIVAMLTESTEGNVRNLLAGMLRAAPDVARVRDLLDAGAREGADFAPELVEAVRRYGLARESGQKVEQYLAQGSLISDDAASPKVAELMRQLERDARAPTRVADMIRGMVQEIDAGGDPRQGGLFVPESQRGAIDLGRRTPRQEVPGEYEARQGEPADAFKVGRLADDATAQQRFLQRRAAAAGFKDIDEWGAADFDGFMRAAEQWRARNRAAALLGIPVGAALAAAGEDDEA